MAHCRHDLTQFVPRQEIRSFDHTSLRPYSSVLQLVLDLLPVNGRIILNNLEIVIMNDLLERKLVENVLVINFETFDKGLLKHFGNSACHTEYRLPPVMRITCDIG
jgi:hypothetical protein